MSNIVCPGCHKSVEIGTAAFCPYCGTKLSQVSAASKQPIPEEIQQGLKDIAKEQDVKKKNRLIDDLLVKYPDSLALNTEKLFVTRLPNPKSRKIDYSVIKCHLLHYYLTPDDFTNDEKASMRNDIFHHPQLEKCLSLSDNPDLYMRDYVRRLCREFVSIFLHGSTLYNRSLLGIRLERRMDKYLAAPVGKMMGNIYKDGGLTNEQRDWLYNAMGEGLSSEVGSTAYLEEMLSECGLPAPERL